MILWNEDCLQAMQKIPDGVVDMVLCDLPYGVTNRGNPLAQWDHKLPFDKLWSEWNRVCKKNAAIVLFGSGMFTAECMMSNPENWRYNLIWKKGTVVTGFLNANKMPMRNHEDIMVFYRRLPVYNPQITSVKSRLINPHSGKDSINGEYSRISPHKSDFMYPKSIVDIPSNRDTKKFHHPTEKPVALCSWLIRTYTNSGDVVLDNCMGSGSTGVACMLEGRDFIGIELDKKFFSVAKQRIAEVQK